MDTNVIVDNATQRAEAVRAQRQAEQTQAVEAARAEVQRVYDEGKARLPKLEQAIQQRMRPQLARLATVAVTAGLALPQQVRQWQAELTKACDAVPTQLRQGLHRFETLTYRDLAGQDGRVDNLKQREWVGLTRSLLYGTDGALREMEQRWQNIDEFLKEWPPLSPG